MDRNTSTLSVKKLDPTKLYPITSIPEKPKTVYLSILDATVATFATTSAIWFYPAVQPITSKAAASPLSIDRLEQSLQIVISHYPWLSGQLRWAHSSDAPFTTTTHEKRFRRLAITYHTDMDPGALYVKATCDSHSLDQLIANPDQRPPEWDPHRTGWATNHFVPDLNLLAFYNFPRSQVEGSCFAVQITEFRCGGIALGIAFSHQVADAIVLTSFMHDWSRIHAAVTKGHDVPEVAPTFDPSLLDARATGDIDGSSPDLQIVARARGLPMLRYDYWVDLDGQTMVDRLPLELRNNSDIKIQHDTPIRWSDWDRSAATSRILHFTSQEITNMHSAATRASQSSISITRHDIVLAHVWQCINTARMSILNLDLETEVYLTTTLGIRARLSLPQSFIGSPLLITYIPRQAGTFASATSSPTTEAHNKQTESLSRIAVDIHQTQKLFNANAIGDILHDAAFELCPHRLWGSMLGSRHTLSTSWIHTHVYEDVDFGCDRLIPWYVHASMDALDGLLVVLEARPGIDTKSTDKWYDRGVDVNVALRSDVIEEMLKGEFLRRWR